MNVSRLACLIKVITIIISQDSAVSIATGYGLHGPRVESRWE
jgi:hypothetical protein